MSSFNDLMAFQRETQALGQVAGRLGWDQETVMPPQPTRDLTQRLSFTLERHQIIKRTHFTSLTD